MDIYLMMKFARSTSLGSLCLVLALGATFSLPQLLADQPATAPIAADPYTSAVNAYVDAATKEMAGVRKELETADKQGKKEAYAAARVVFDKCDALVTRLKAATRGQFDPTKAEYERTRATLQTKLKEARHAPAPAPVTPAPASK